MSDAMARLDEKTSAQKSTARNLKKRFQAAMDIAVNDSGYCLDELNYFGTKAFREIIAELRKRQTTEA